MTRGGFPSTQKHFSGIQGTAAIEVFEAWWRGARKGTEFVYCEALEPIRNETWIRVGELAQLGFLRAHERLRAGGGRSWYAVRTGKQIASKPDPQEAVLADPLNAIIYRALKRAANFGLACPTDTDLMRAAGFDMRQKAAWRVRRLIDVGLIESTQVYEGGVASRVVTIADTRHAGPAANKFTALPRKWGELQRAASAS